MQWEIAQNRDAEFLILDPVEFERLLEGGPVEMAAPDKTHLRKALRKTGNFEIWVGDGRGRVLYSAVDDRDQISALHPPQKIERPLESGLIMPPIKRKYLDYLTQKCSEAGVAAIHFIRSEREAGFHEKPDRLLKIARSACMQAKNPYLPQIEFTNKKLADYVETEVNTPLPETLYFWGDFTSDVSLYTFLGATAVPQRIFFINGPEGGWSPEETQLLKNRFPGVLLSHHVLRSDTAALCAVAAMTMSREKQ